MKLIFLFLCSLVLGSDFDLFMGKNTKHWAHLQQEEELELLYRFKEVYEKNDPSRQPSFQEAKIPRVVHYIWLGPKPFPQESVENVRTWMAKNPDWKFKFWTDQDRPVPCRGMEKIVLTDYPFPFLKRCYELSENW